MSIIDSKTIKAIETFLSSDEGMTGKSKIFGIGDTKLDVCLETSTFAGGNYLSPYIVIITNKGRKGQYISKVSDLNNIL